MERTKHVLLIGLLLLLAYLPIAFFWYPLLYDMIDTSLPWRFFIGECLQQGFWPLWNPHINYGFPQFAESQTWYPISFILGATSRYSLLDLNLELMFHLLLAGWGMYAFLAERKVQIKVAFTLAVVYTCSGFFVGNGQHMSWVIGGAWIPWVLFSFSRLCTKPNIDNAVRLSLFLYLLLTGGYPAFFIVNGYVLILWAASNLGSTFFTVSRKSALVLLGFLFLAIICFAAMAAGVVSAGWELSTFITRGQALPVEQLNLGSLSFMSLVSFLNPTAVSADADFWQVLDFGIVNVFFGSFLFVLLIIGLFKLRGNLPLTFYAGVFFLLLALGWSTPILPALVDYVPFLNKFRFASLYRFFTLFFWIWTLGLILSKESNYLWPIKRVLAGVFTFHLLVTIIAVWQVNLWPIQTSMMGHFLKAHDIAYNTFLGAITLLIITGLGLLWLHLKGGKTVIYAVIIAEVMVHVIVMGPIHLYNKNSPKPAEQHLVQVPVAWPLPNLQKPAKDLTDPQLEQVSFLWRNKAHYTKQFSAGGYTPYSFTGLGRLRNKVVFQRLLQQPMVFFSTSLDLKMDTSSTISPLDFSPTQVAVSVKNAQQGVLVFQQNFYPYWEAWVNGKKVELLKVKEAFMGVRLPKGNNQVVFRFQPKSILNYILFGGGLFFGLSILLVFRKIRQLVF